MTIFQCFFLFPPNNEEINNIIIIILLLVHHRMEPPTKKQRTSPLEEEDQTPLSFFRETKPFGELSNFWKTEEPLTWRSKTYATSEHLYQSRKYIYKGASPACLELAESIRQATTPYKAKLLASDPTKIPRRHAWQRKLHDVASECAKKGALLCPKWQDLRLEVMRSVVRLKLVQDSHSRQVLLSTGHRKLVEASPYDSFWGSGKDGSGRNELGKLLMEFRRQLQKGVFLF